MTRRPPRSTPQTLVSLLARDGNTNRCSVLVSPFFFDVSPRRTRGATLDRPPVHSFRIHLRKARASSLRAHVCIPTTAHAAARVDPSHSPCGWVDDAARRENTHTHNSLSLSHTIPHTHRKKRQPTLRATNAFSGLGSTAKRRGITLDGAGRGQRAARRSWRIQWVQPTIFFEFFTAGGERCRRRGPGSQAGWRSRTSWGSTSRGWRGSPEGSTC